MPNIEKFENSPEFIIDGNHARFGHNKLATYSNVSLRTIYRYLVALSKHYPEKAERIRKMGWSGKDTNEFIGYYATSDLIKKEVKNHCISLLIQSSENGFQHEIDKMAGLTPENQISIEKYDLVITMLQQLQQHMEENQKSVDIKINLLMPFVEEGKIAKTLYKYLPNFENLLKQVAQEFESNPCQEYRHLKIWTFELGFRDLSRGEKIAIGKIVSGFAILGDPEWLPDSSKKGRKKYPEAFKPVIKEATLYILSKRRYLRLIS